MLKISNSLEFDFALASHAPICYGEILTKDTTFSGHMYTKFEHNFNFYILDEYNLILSKEK